jgi:succinate dehydrogenase / fumarate reductase cytochrome b subunit
MSTLLRKYLMAVTGLFLSLFLVVHLAGNLQLLLPPDKAQAAFNLYAETLSSLVFIKLIAWGLYAFIILHAVYALVITIANRKAGENSKYANDGRSAASTWASRNMGFLGSILLVFLIIHMSDYWYQFKFGTLPLDGNGNRDLYTIVVNSFDTLWYVALYVTGFIALGYHLWHGFFSAFRTMGLHQEGLATFLHYTGIVFTIVITGGFIVIPIYLYLS